MKKKLLNTIELANYLGITDETLRQWKQKKILDIPEVKVSNRVQYDIADVDAFIESRKSTLSEAQA